MGISMNRLIVENRKFHTLQEMFSVSNNFQVIAGPCSVESEEQIYTVAEKVKSLDLAFFRGGAYKPRTSPYEFQGMGKEGLILLKQIKEKYNLITVSEIIDIRNIEIMIDHVDIIQVGSRNMTNFSLLSELGTINTPVLLKRGLMSTIDEFVYAAEYIAMGGNENIVMCERGIRTFDSATRNTLDLACVAIIKERTSLPVIVDLSHSLGRKDIIVQMAKASRACGADGIMAETHNCPEKALSDSRQQLSFDELEKLVLAIRA